MHRLTSCQRRLLKEQEAEQLELESEEPIENPKQQEMADDEVDFDLEGEEDISDVGDDDDIEMMKAGVKVIKILQGAAVKVDAASIVVTRDLNNTYLGDEEHGTLGHAKDSIVDSIANIRKQLMGISKNTSNQAAKDLFDQFLGTENEEESVEIEEPTQEQEEPTTNTAPEEELSLDNVEEAFDRIGLTESEKVIAYGAINHLITELASGGVAMGNSSFFKTSKMTPPAKMRDISQPKKRKKKRKAKSGWDPLYPV